MQWRGGSGASRFGDGGLSGGCAAPWVWEWCGEAVALGLREGAL